MTMAYFLFQPDKEVEVGDAWMNQGRAIEPLSYLYNSKADVWMVLDPKSGNWINFMAGLPCQLQEQCRNQTPLLA